MLIMTTIDDLPPEGIPYIIDRIMDCGAKNVHILNALTKKGRMEYIIFIDFEKDILDEISSLLALEFGTIGMKVFEYKHIKFPYKLEEKIFTIDVEGTSFKGKVKIKYLYDNNEIISVKAEYEDIKALGRKLTDKGFNISFSKIKTIVEAEAYNNISDKKIKITL